MEKTRREIMDRVYLTYLPAKKFKTSCLSAQFITPLRRETASYGRCCRWCSSGAP